MKRFIISEDERARILSMHETAIKKEFLSEQQSQPTASAAPASAETKKPLQLNLGKTFASGKYIIRDTTALDPYIKQIQNYLSPLSNQKVDITVHSSESKVPNYDGEVEGNPKLPEGDLAQKRMDSVYNFINQKFSDNGIMVSLSTQKQY